ncbi:MAG: hypothetical protein KDA89_19630 [Planctomycetaceae bacterium]|nr:hypothetical protein [Planctomycetaceae bacterium]
MATKAARKNRKTVQKNQDSHQECPHCRGGEETYGYFKRAYVFDVDLARKIVADGREPIELDRNDVEYSVEISRIYPQHLDHVDPQYAGIVAHLWGPGEDGNWLHGHLLIDGHHRAARCLRDDLPYFVHILTEEESQRVLKRGPKMMPA